MSRIGQKPIVIPDKVELIIEGDSIIVTGPKGQLSQIKSELVECQIKDNLCSLSRQDETKKAKSEHGLMRSLINNMIIGVTDGFEKKLEIVGIGYRVRQSSSMLVFSLGFSHEIEFPIPEGVEATIEGSIITIKGMDKQQIGQIAASIRQLKKPEPYKGKGIRYQGEVVRRKAGKGAKV